MFHERYSMSHRKEQPLHSQIGRKAEWEGGKEKERAEKMQSLCEMLSEVLTPECKLLTRTFNTLLLPCACYVNNMKKKIPGYT